MHKEKIRPVVTAFVLNVLAAWSDSVRVIIIFSGCWVMVYSSIYPQDQSSLHAAE